MDVKATIARYCNYQERCHKEVRNKLYELGCRKQEVEEQIAALISAGMLNEERYAKAIARGKFKMLRWGRRKIVQYLKNNGVSDYCIGKAMMEIPGEEYSECLKNLAEKKYLEIKTIKSKLEQKTRLLRYMMQKGYEQDIVYEIVNELIR